MKQILLIQPDNSVRKSLIQNIEESLNLTAITRSDIGEGVQLLTLLQNIDLVILYPTSTAEWQQFTEEWKDVSNPPPLIIVSKLNLSQHQSFSFTHIDANLHWLFIIKVIADFFSIDLYQIADNIIDTYVPIACYDLYLFEKAPFSIFSHEIDNRMQEYYQIIFERQAVITPEKIKSLQQAGHKQLYLREEDLVPFLNLMIEHFDRKRQSGEFTLSQLIYSAKELHGQAIAVLSAIGTSTTLSELVSHATTTIIEAWLKRYRLSKLLNMVMNSEGTLLFQHFSLTSILACEMEKARKEKIDHETIKKLTYATFLHDMSISYNFNLTQLIDQKKLSKANLSHYDYQRVFEHAARSSQLAKTMGVPEGVESIILHHHGKSDGIGFDLNFAPSISPLTHILSVAERFSFSLLNVQYFSTEQVNVKKIIDELDSELKNTSSHVYVDLLKKIFIREKKIENQEDVNAPLSA